MGSSILVKIFKMLFIYCMAIMESAVNIRRDSNRIQGSGFMWHVLMVVQITHVI